MIIDSTKWERLSKEDHQKASNKFQEAVKLGEDKGYDFNGFSQDLYSYLYKSQAPEVPKNSPSKGAEWAHKALSEIKNLPEFSNLRENGTACDSFRSGLGATIMARHFAESFNERKTENPDDIEEKMEGKEEGSPEHDELSLQLEEAQAEWGSDDPDKMRRVLRAALKDAEETIEEVENGILGFGIGDTPGDDGFSSVEDKLALAAKIEENPKLKEISELAGRMKSEASHQRSNKKDAGPDEINSIELGNDIGRLLPSELQMFDDPDLEILFLKNFAEKSLLQYRLEESQKETKGPIVFCLDMSGSMRGANEVWAKAVVLAMAQIAMQDNRAFHVIQFNNSVLRSDSFVNKVSPLDLAECMATNASGGTNFMPPLQEAFDKISNGGEFDKADIVFVSDGGGRVDEKMMEDLKKTKEAKGLEVICVELGSFTGNPVREIADEIFPISNLAEDNAALESLFSV